MLKLILVAILLIAAVTTVAAAPVEGFEPLASSEEVEGFEEPQEHLRFRRVTCDLLSFSGDTACAANCLSMGKAGGTCQNGICVCRSDTLEEQIDRRFGPFDDRLKIKSNEDFIYGVNRVTPRPIGPLANKAD